MAADVFFVQETDETLWDDSHQLAMASEESAAELRELMSIWRYIHGHPPRHELPEYGQDPSAPRRPRIPRDIPSPRA